MVLLICAMSRKEGKKQSDFSRIKIQDHMRFCEPFNVAPSVWTHLELFHPDLVTWLLDGFST